MMGDWEENHAEAATLACRSSPQAIAARQQVRLAELVTFARQHSPFYAEKHRLTTEPNSQPVNVLTCQPYQPVKIAKDDK
jgi:hypothetical protein